MSSTGAAPALPPLRVLVVDDEELARARLRGLLLDCTEPRCAVAGEAARAAQALAWLHGHPDDCDLVLLDIRLPGRDGLQLAAELRRLPQPPALVFVTAHAEHALAAFDLDAADYLTKPVRRERLQAALQRVAQRLSRGAGLPAPSAPSAPSAPVVPVAPVGAWTPAATSEPPLAAASGPSVLVVSDRGRVLRVPVGEVLYLKAELKYVTLRTAGRSYVLDDALSDLEQRLGDRFLRVHRNALVARHAVRALERRSIAGNDEEVADDGGGPGWAVRVAPVDEWLAVSRRQATAVREALAAGGL